jgi:TATA-box binding protein (TBP) (component of TFIID and TFIIIB)
MQSLINVIYIQDQYGISRNIPEDIVYRSIFLKGIRKITGYNSINVIERNYNELLKTLKTNLEYIESIINTQTNIDNIVNILSKLTNFAS